MGDGAKVAAEVDARITPDEREAHDWLVVLGAAGVPCRMERGPDGWRVVIAAGDGARAADALAAYDSERIESEPADGRDWGPTRAGLVLAGLLVVAWAFTGFRADGRPAFLAGEGYVAAIRAGQWWRCVTALMLHADATHLLGNVAAMALLGSAVCGRVGPGLGVFLILAAGAGGNALNAVIRDAPHVSVGASTAIFGALGILAGLAILRARPRRPWMPIAASLALLGLLGTGEHADLIAHFAGFQVGIGLGLATAVITSEPPSVRGQRVFALLTALVVAGSWMLALKTLRRG